MEIHYGEIYKPIERSPLTDSMPGDLNKLAAVLAGKANATAIVEADKRKQQVADILHDVSGSDGFDLIINPYSGNDLSSLIKLAGNVHRVNIITADSEDILRTAGYDLDTIVAGVNLRARHNLHAQGLDLGYPGYLAEMLMADVDLANPRIKVGTKQLLRGITLHCVRFNLANGQRVNHVHYSGLNLCQGNNTTKMFIRKMAAETSGYGNPLLVAKGIIGGSGFMNDLAAGISGRLTYLSDQPDSGQNLDPAYNELHKPANFDEPIKYGHAQRVGDIKVFQKAA